MNNKDVRAEIVNQFTLVAHEQGRELADLQDGLGLLESGLDSLSFAIIVARLEVALGVDPFSSSENTTFPVTFGDLVEFYENAVNQPQ